MTRKLTLFHQGVFKLYRVRIEGPAFILQQKLMTFSEPEVACDKDWIPKSPINMIEIYRELRRVCK